jgi:hypothetical protein
MSHLQPGYPGADQNIEKLTKMVGKSKITAAMGEDQKEHDKYEVFEAICVLKDAARDLYCDGDMKWDEMVTELSAAILKLKGKENELAQMDKDAEKAGTDEEET